MSVNVICPNPDCQAPLHLATAPVGGTRVRCPRCGQGFAALPEEEPPAPAAALEAPIRIDSPPLELPPEEEPWTPPPPPRNLGTDEDLSGLLEEASERIALARRELWRVPEVLGLGEDPDLAVLRRPGQPDRCANPSCQTQLDSAGRYVAGGFACTSRVTFSARGETVVLDLCVPCMQVLLDDLRSRERAALDYLRDAREQLQRASRRWPRHPEIERAMKEVRIIEILTNGEKPRRRPCFVATAAFGGPFAAEVATLRRFRDEVLERSAAGRGLTRVYYWVAPALAAAIAGSPWRRALARRLLAPVAAWCGRLLGEPVRESGKDDPRAAASARSSRA